MIRYTLEMEELTFDIEAAVELSSENMAHWTFKASETLRKGKSTSAYEVDYSLPMRRSHFKEMTEQLGRMLPDTSKLELRDAYSKLMTWVEAIEKLMSPEQPQSLPPQRRRRRRISEVGEETILEEQKNPPDETTE